MLPSNPRATLPRGPLAVPTRRRDLGQPTPPLKPAKSISSLGSRAPIPSRSRTLSRPEKPSRYHGLRIDSDRAAEPLPSTLTGYSHRSNDSSSSASSSGSSAFSRNRDDAGYSSSRTSLDDESYSMKAIEHQSTQADVSNSSVSGAYSNNTNADQGYGFHIWSRVADVANALSANVSKAWAVKVPFAEPPPGDESHLLRAMRAFHISKARDTSELPQWLFGEEERRQSNIRPLQTEHHDDVVLAIASQKDGGSATRTWDEPDRSRGADRLKAMRDAKRAGVNTSVDASDPGVGARIAPTARVGLPSRPRRG